MRQFPAASQGLFRASASHRSWGGESAAESEGGVLQSLNDRGAGDEMVDLECGSSSALPAPHYSPRLRGY
ncbi:hypothetical protein NDU88_001484 [Pleurodeles waltl]|uniref:Uncharacterized protein n=1 Tax=Pleurodeles waltl TaxID=8319 RepID=A0AAV7V7Z3_PLEWA|nr:hypothetical protein NDU88_001484 [Pleurodeles waltl]